MKKILLFALAIGFVGVGLAQVSQYKPKAWYKDVKLVDNKAKIAEQVFTYSNEISPNTPVSRAQDVVVGETWYDLQSNSSVPRHIYAFEDGTIGTVWTRGMNPTAYADRGTGYNYFDGSSWGAYPTERIEEVRTGWPSYAPYGINGEIVCTHSGGAAGLIFSWRENKGEGEWSYFSLVGPAGFEDILWPRMVTSGENHEIIHVIAAIADVANGGGIYQGLDGALLYSRSTDGGLTWDPENVVLDGISSDYTNGWSADDYAWAEPVGNTIAFFTFGGIKDGIVMKSIDNGDNWERIVAFASFDPFFVNGDLIPAFGGGDGFNACAIDDEGLVHVAFGRQIHSDDDGGGPYYYPYTDGLVYWNETMPALDSAMIQADIIPDNWTTMNLYQNGNLAAYTLEHGSDTLVGIAPYYTSLTGMPQIVITRDDFGTKIVQIFYSAVSVGFDNSEYNFRHIWGSFTEGDGKFSAFTDYTSDVFHIFSECSYPSASPTVTNNKFHIIYQSDNMPGNSNQPDPPTHDPVLNNMVYLAVSPLPVDVTESSEQSIEISQNYPNPFNGKTYVNITINKASNVNLEVYTLTGQKVVVNEFGFKTAGSHNISIDASNLASGIYFYTVTAGESKVTRKMVVE
ncbi:MAG: hypothetical protein COW63_04140 [Bacteroidetes bacterium CG18_big_fil_WC_8_21_14_2_50_41_14]|nr:MAG: hypothetical protein COW63_04140 [Bacteroidetes bacterium CG18_big_fil_WC_8_21_14_2_50_41_14]PJB59402.1 MAG: hypothetical protein CO098_03600 [Bacteroidetes bacterium CG_4_9_14_3_um_filter_41_19]